MFDKDMFIGAYKAKGKTLKEMAEAIGVSESSLSKKLNGKSDFSRNEISLTAAALDLSDDQVLDIFFKQT